MLLLLAALVAALAALARADCSVSSGRKRTINVTMSGVALCSFVLLLSGSGSAAGRLALMGSKLCISAAFSCALGAHCDVSCPQPYLLTDTHHRCVRLD